MAFDYEEAASTALSLLQEFGRQVTVRRLADAVDPVEGSVERTSLLTQKLYAAVLPASGGTLEAFDARFMGDVQDVTNVRFCIMSAKGSKFQPEPKDEVDMSGETWQVMGCTPLNVAGVPLVYSVGLKRP